MVYIDLNELQSDCLFVTLPTAKFDLLKIDVSKEYSRAFSQ